LKFASQEPVTTSRKKERALPGKKKGGPEEFPSERRDGLLFWLPQNATGKSAAPSQGGKGF